MSWQLNHLLTPVSCSTPFAVQLWRNKCLGIYDTRWIHIKQRVILWSRSTRHLSWELQDKQATHPRWSIRVEGRNSPSHALFLKECPMRTVLCNGPGGDCPGSKATWSYAYVWNEGLLNHFFKATIGIPNLVIITSPTGCMIFATGHSCDMGMTFDDSISLSRWLPYSKLLKSGDMMSPGLLNYTPHQWLPHWDKHHSRSRPIWLSWPGAGWRWSGWPVRVRQWGVWHGNYRSVRHVDYGLAKKMEKSSHGLGESPRQAEFQERQWSRLGRLRTHLFHVPWQ